MSKSQKDIHLNPPVRMPHRKMPAFESWVLPVFSLATGLMTFSAANNLLGSPVKAALIGGAAGVVSYAVNFFAIEKGAELCATGFKVAGAVSVISMAAVGAGLFPSTYAGLVIKDVDELQIHKYISNQTHFIDERNRLATKATRLIPVIQVNEEELIQYRDCEQKESCLSGRSQGGRGRVTKLLEEKARRAATITEQLKAGEDDRKASLKRLNKLREDFQNVFHETGKPIKERRQNLIGIDAKIKQEIATLNEALPVSLLQAYVSELETGVSIRNRPVATKNFNALLDKQAQGLSSVLSTLKDKGQAQPQFPSPAGVWTTFDFLPYFLPVGLLAASIELILPISLWVYVLLGLIWQKHKEELRSNHYPVNAHPRKLNGSSKGGTNKPNRSRHQPSYNNHKSH